MIVPNWFAKFLLKHFGHWFQVIEVKCRHCGRFVPTDFADSHLRYFHPDEKEL
jgi:hypothetical protein